MTQDTILTQFLTYFPPIFSTFWKFLKFQFFIIFIFLYIFIYFILFLFFYFFFYYFFIFFQDPQPSKIAALQLLDAQFADHKVRALAVQCLESMTNDELRRYMIQLIQAVKFEQHTDSALSRFLQRRSLQAPTTVGRAFFW